MFLGDKFSAVNKAICNKNLTIVMKASGINLKEKDYQIIMIVEENKIISLEIIASDVVVLNIFVQIFNEHIEIIIPPKLRSFIKIHGKSQQVLSFKCDLKNII